MYRQGRNREFIANEITNELDRIGEWCKTSGASVNPTKATVTWFFLNNHIGHTPTPTITMNGETLARTNTMKYLRVLFDRSLTFKDHVDHTIARARKELVAMRVMAAAHCEQRLLALLYQGLVLSVIDYALAILTLSITQTERLDKIQNEPMRIILGCIRDTSTRTMRLLLDYPTMKHRVQICSSRAYLRSSADKEIYYTMY